MKEKIAVATVSGKAYYLIVSELKRRNIPFLSLTPNERIPVEIKVVITTEGEKKSINHENVLAYKEGMRPEELINEALQILQGREYEKIVIGVDPGEVFGVAILADGKVIETGNCFSVGEISAKIKDYLKTIRRTAATSVSVKVGDGAPAYKEKLLRALDYALPSDVKIECVSEAGTDRHINETKHRRGLRDIVSAIRIAGRSGQKYQRMKRDETSNS
ncbi:MAG: hypothetical protein QW667_00545 [Candidatus Bathyarchaeia archaeon]